MAAEVDVLDQPEGEGLRRLIRRYVRLYPRGRRGRASKPSHGKAAELVMIGSLRL
jgi:hypothetical protein